MPSHNINLKEKGVYQCAKCGLDIFGEEARFIFKTKWLSFKKARKGALSVKLDYSYGVEDLEIEILCARCGLHLGHVLKDSKEWADSKPKAIPKYLVFLRTLHFKR